MNAVPSFPRIWCGLWSLLWRSVVFFPRGVLLLALPFGLMAAWCFCLAQALVSALEQSWWMSAVYLVGLVIASMAWRYYHRWATSPNDE